MIVLFRKIGINRQVLNNVQHHSIVWETPKCGYMIAVSWALTKGDWWKDKNEKIAKFFSWNWKKHSGEYVRTGIYIGQLAIVWQIRPKGFEPNESA
jgi:hypothetical protein